MCSVSSVLNTFANSDETETLSSSSKWPWISPWMFSCRQVWSALYSAEPIRCSVPHIPETLVTLFYCTHKIWGRVGGQWGMLGSISLKLHWFAVGVTGAQVMVGSTQLEMNPCSLMRRRDKRVANYSVLLCTENNLVLLRPSMINLLQLWLCLFFTLEDFKGGC